MLTLEDFGKNLKSIREKLGFSQEYVAEKLGVARQAIISIESGKRKVDSFELFKLADLFGVDAKELLESRNVEFAGIEEAVLHLRKKKKLTEGEKQALIEFQSICKDYDFLKKL